MTWFKNTELLDNTKDSVTIAVPNIFAQRQFEVKFNDQIRSILEKNGVTLYRVRYAGFSERTANAACKAVKKSSLSCFTLRN